MGSFSFLRVDNLNKSVNIVENQSFKCLIPKEFGGGFIKDHYQDYGDLYIDGVNVYDMYELLAQWNQDIIREHFDPNHKLMINPTKTTLKKVDRYTDQNRSLGIDFYHQQKVPVDYPLKLVAARCKDTYEDIEIPSLSDPNQGFCSLDRNGMDFIHTIQYNCKKYKKNGQVDLANKILKFYNLGS